VTLELIKNAEWQWGGNRESRSILSGALLASALLASTSVLALAGRCNGGATAKHPSGAAELADGNKDYSLHRYSALDQINKDNVKALHVAFTVPLGGAFGVAPMRWGGHQSTPLVDDGQITSSTVTALSTGLTRETPAPPRSPG
jgi:alcohol dehydrogenase (cytochrome c)